MTEGDDLLRIEALATALLRNLDAPARRSMLRRVAKKVRASQRARIEAQRNPDGSGFAPRRKRPEPVRGNRAVHFLYPKDDPAPREVYMKSWTLDGPLMTGFDIKAGGIRSFHREQIGRWLPLDEGQENAGAGELRRKGHIRRKAMFRKLLSPSHLREGATDSEAWIGFVGQAARVGRIHQEGLVDKPAAKAKPVRYARRRLLGMTDADRTMVSEAFLAALVDGRK
ncbi:hypothetical protein ASE70_05640 [Sphingomonas sp. Leaf22]|uniref:phage virion morphogenesis protein n=1 Tax=Sphingomonas sp. Leaf22 TaxID=1735687 RepID=UPI000701D7FA|nr:phage virion morphogenesis protein [Sphingomonas sp. Leaf22]KQM79351.1 hypothetical protein ASE70_05640 [Sphingomonas sp. Leaf22]